MATIRVHYTSIDRSSKTRTYKTLKGARAFAQKWVGKHPEMGSFYAVSFDGIGKVTVSGCSLADLFPAPPNKPSFEAGRCCCPNPQPRGGKCSNCGTWIED